MCVVKWSDPPATMISKLEDRLDWQKVRPDYRAYWGFMQKELLPVMDQNRLSPSSAALLAVLNRNQWIRVPHSVDDSHVFDARWGGSSLRKNADRISDKAWLKIIQSPPKDKTSWRTRESRYLQISTLLGEQALKHPARFAELSLCFPKDCYTMYITSILRAQEHTEEGVPVANIDLLSKVICHFASSDNDEILGAIADIVHARATEAWSDDVLQIIKAIAVKPPSKSESHVLVEEKDKSANSLYSLVINTPQGQAIRAIEQLLFADHARFDIYKDAITTLSGTAEPYIMLALADCALPCYNIDEHYAVALFKKLVAKDIRVTISGSTWDFICRDFKNDPIFYRNYPIDTFTPEKHRIFPHRDAPPCGEFL